MGMGINSCHFSLFCSMIFALNQQPDQNRVQRKWKFQVWLFVLLGKHQSKLKYWDVMSILFLSMCVSCFQERYLFSAIEKKNVVDVFCPNVSVYSCVGQSRYAVDKRTEGVHIQHLTDLHFILHQAQHNLSL